MKNVPQRYFFFSYSCRNNTKIADGNLWFDCDKFPSNEIVRDEAAKKSGFPANKIIVMSMFEFNDKNDFESFGLREK